MKVLLFDRDSKADPVSAHIKYAKMLVRSNPKKWAIVEEDKPQATKKEAIVVTEVEAKEAPKPRRRRATKKEQ